MEMRYGFKRPILRNALPPKIDDKIKTICPSSTIRLDPKNTGDAFWGAIHGIWKGYSTQLDLRFKASSGGAVSAIALHLLHAGEVDGIWHTGADPKNLIGTKSTTSRSSEDVMSNAGSRYAPSSPLEKIEPALAGEHRYVFIGKPCDVSALRALAKIDARVDKTFPWMLSFFCAGVPSQRGAEELLSRMKLKKERLLEFRYRGHGWPGHAMARTRSGHEARLDYRTAWGDVLTKHVQTRCKICPDGVGMQADIVCADAWNILPDGTLDFSENPGQSLIIARSLRGKDVIEKMIQNGSLFATVFDVSQLPIIQPGQYFRKTVVQARLTAMRICGLKVPKFVGFRLGTLSRHASLLVRARNMLGMMRRSRNIIFQSERKRHQPF